MKKRRPHHRGIGRFRQTAIDVQEQRDRNLEARYAWEDRRRDGIHSDIFARRVEVDGTVPNPDGFDVASSAEDETDPVVTAAAGNRPFAVVYHRVANEAPYGGATRAFLRTVSPK